MLLHCATMALLPHAPPLAAPPAHLTPPGDKVLRDPFGVPNVAMSDNFAVWWGDDGLTDPDDVDVLLDSFEHAWAVQIGTMAHPPPAGSDATLFTVVLGDTGDGAPSSYGTAGYFYVDADGYPFVVISPAVLWDEDLTASTSAHEFYHAIQATTGRYLYEGEAAWYWESTAEWAADQTIPHNPYNASFLFAYAEHPHLPVDFFDYPDTGAVMELFQYGSFVFPLHLSEVGGFEVIRDSWVVPGEEPDPLETLRTLLAAQELDLDQAWLDHVARNVTWDYDEQDLFSDNVDLYESFVPGDRIAVELSGYGESDLEVKGDPAPRRYGYTLVSLVAPRTGTLTVEIQGQKKGSRGRPASYGARLVRVMEDGATITHPLHFEGPDATLVVEDVGEESEIWLAVGAWTPELDLEDWLDEKFPFTFSMAIATDEPLPEPPSAVDDEDGGCACGATQSGSILLLAVPLAVIRMRRRGLASCPPTRP